MSEDFWPVNEETGAPMAKIMVGREEKLNIGNYSNVTIGPASITKFVRDDEEYVRQAYKDCYELIEEILKEKREILLEEISVK